MNRLISRTSILRIFLLFLGCTATTTNAALNLEPDHLTGAKKDAALNRPRRNADPAASALEYMVNLRNQLSEETGEPRLLNEDDPTEVWALQDSGKLNCCTDRGYINYSYRGWIIIVQYITLLHAIHYHNDRDH